jgi:hypothetical protein
MNIPDLKEREGCFPVLWAPYQHICNTGEIRYTIQGKVALNELLVEWYLIKI